MREKSQAPRATRTITPAPGATQNPPSRGSSGGQPNSTARRSTLQPYHDIAGAVFTVNDTAELEPMFLAAARDGDFARIEALLRKRSEVVFSVDVRDSETGNSAIIFAAMRGHYKIVEVLLKHGADITARNFDGQTAIEVASPKIRQLLLESADIGGPHRNLLQAAWQGNARLVSKILAETSVDINCRNSEGLTPLLLVTRDVQLFEKLGDKITKGYNPVDVVTELLSHRADPNVVDEDGRTPLHYVSTSKALQSGDLATILLENGADIDSRDRRSFAPLHAAAQSGNIAVVLALLDRGSEVNARGYAGTTPLHISAINGHHEVIGTLLVGGADVTLVDDSGLTCVDVAKTKKVKATLKEAWTEATQARPGSELKPVKTHSAEGLRRANQNNHVTGISQNRAKRTGGGGEIIFDLKGAWKSQSWDSSLHFSPLSNFDLSLATPSPLTTTEAITPRRAGTIASIERHLSNADKARRAEDLMYKDSSGAPYRGRTPTTGSRSPTAGRRLSPIKTQASPRKNPKDIKFSPGTKLYDGTDNQGAAPGSWKHGGLKKCPSDPSRYPGGATSTQLPVTVVGLDLDDSLQEAKVKKVIQGPMSQTMPSRKVHIRHHSEPYAAAPHYTSSPHPADVGSVSDEIYLKGTSPSRTSVVSASEDYDDSVPLSASPPRLTPIRNLSASDRNKGLRIPTTIDERSTTTPGNLQYMLDLDRMQLSGTHGNSHSPVLSGATVYPNSHRVLPPTATYLTELPPEGSDMTVLRYSEDFVLGSKNSSPRYDNEVGGKDNVRLAVNDAAELTRGRSILKDGSFNIEDTRIRNSDDSGIPDDKGSSKSSSVSSSVSNLSSGSPGPPESQVFHEEVAPPGGKHVVNVLKTTKSDKMTKSQSDSILAKPQKNHTNKMASVGNSEKDGSRVQGSTSSKQTANVTSSQNTENKSVTGAGNKYTVSSGASNTPRNKQDSGKSVEVRDQTVPLAGPSKSQLYSSYKDVKTTTDTVSTEQTVTTDSSTGRKVTTTVTHIQLQHNVPVEKKGSVVKSTLKTKSSSEPSGLNTKCNVTKAGAGTKPSVNAPVSMASGKVTPAKGQVAANNKSGANTAKVKPPVPARPTVTPRTATTPQAAGKNDKTTKSQQGSLLKTSVAAGPATTTSKASPSNNKSESKQSGAVVESINDKSTRSIGNKGSSESLVPAGKSSHNTGVTNIDKTKTSSNTRTSKGLAQVTSQNGAVSKSAGVESKDTSAKMTHTNSSQNSVSSKNGASVNTSVSAKSSEAPARPPPPTVSSASSLKVEQVDVPVAKPRKPATVESTSSKPTTTAASPAASVPPPAALSTSTSAAPIRTVLSSGHIPSASEAGQTAQSAMTPVTSVRGAGSSSRIGSATSCSSSVPNVKCIQVKPYEGDAKVIAEHNGPVITDPFESLTREREQAKHEQSQDTGKVKDKTAVKQKQMMYPKKAKTPDARATSAGKRIKKVSKNAGDETPSRPPRPRSKKAKGKRKKKRSDGKEDLLLTDRPEGERGGSAFVSGKGWYIHTECTDTTDVQAIRLHDDSSDSDDDDDTTYVQPNYMDEDSDGDEDVTTRTVLQSASGSLRSSWEKRNPSIPGQIGADEDSGEDVDEEVFDQAEEVHDDVVFTIGSESDNSPLTTERDFQAKDTKAKESVFKSAMTGDVNKLSAGKKPALQQVHVKGMASKVEEVHASAPSVVPQVTEAIEQFAREVSAKDLNDMLEGDLTAGAHDPSTDKKQGKVQTKTNAMRNNERNSKPGREHRNISETDKQTNSGPKNNNNQDVKEKTFKETSSKNNEDPEIDDMINEILKSTPDPSLTLSWRSRSESSNSTKKNSISPATRETLQKHLSQFQTRSFKEVPNAANSDDNSTPESNSLGDSDSTGEVESLTKLADAFKNLPLKVDTESCDSSSVQGRGQVSSVVKTKPPVAPKPSGISRQTTTVVVAMKSPRFVRKHDSLRGVKAAPVREANSMTLGSDFGTASLPVMEEHDSVAPSDRAETVTSRLGRHNTSSQAASEATNASEDIETIQWKRGNLLGKGAYGKVWCGLTNAGELIAVKQIELNVENMDKAEKEYEKIQEEVELLKTLKHQNIVGYLGTSLEDHVVSIFMQFVPGGSIYNLITRFGALEEEVFCRYTLQILEGVEYLHSNNVIHRDIKGGNIMLMPNGVIKLIDFGCAKRLYLNMSHGLNSSGQKHLLKSMRGTPYWMAPEVVREEGHGTKSDIWSIGCTVFEMATMKPPWADVAPYAAIFSIGNNDRPVPKLPEKFTADAREFVSACLTRNQDARPSADRLLTHAFISRMKRKSGSVS